MAFKVLALLALAACPMVLAQQYGQYGHGQQVEQYVSEPHYAYEYAVHDEHTKDIHSQKESRKGDRTEGEYSLVEPDGTIRTVKYHVDGKSGFIAEVIRSGHAVHAPAVVAKPVVAYKPVVAAYKPIVAAAPVYQHAAPAYQAAPAATSYVQNGHNSQYNRHY
ncbi:cuticle protein 7-like [Cloeon dipterum]|uniref:cuticle protein 7-like n=1 Tax=Cloeon dipterum TaxID=197152 RepID=UPI00321FE934